MEYVNVYTSTRIFTIVFEMKNVLVSKDSVSLQVIPGIPGIPKTHVVTLT